MARRSSGCWPSTPGCPPRSRSVALLALVAAVLVLTVAEEGLRAPLPRASLVRVGARLQPIVSGFGHGTGVYVRDLAVLRVDGAGQPLREG